MNTTMKAAALVIARAQDLVSGASRCVMNNDAQIPEDIFFALCIALDNYEALAAEDEQRQREQDRADYEETILSFQGDIEGAIRRGVRR